MNTPISTENAGASENAIARPAATDDGLDLSAPGAYAAELSRVYLVAQIIAGLPLRKMLDAISQAESVAPFVNPSLWIEKGRPVQQDKEVVAALRTAQARIEELLQGARS